MEEDEEEKDVNLMSWLETVSPLQRYIIISSVT